MISNLYAMIFRLYHIRQIVNFINRETRVSENCQIQMRQKILQVPFQTKCRLYIDQ